MAERIYYRRNKFNCSALLLERKLISGLFYNPTRGAAHFTLLNGSMVAIRKSNEVLLIIVDVNSISKPNMLGLDSFMFAYTPRYGLEPWGGRGSELSEGGESFGAYNRKK